MQHIKFDYEVHSVVRYSESDLQILMVAGLAHYDGKCKAACMVGGFIYGMQNYLLLVRPGSAEWTLSCDKLGTIDKILEMAVLQGTPGAGNLKQKVQEILKAISIREKELC